jgi:uncharacterized membrane protein
MTVELRRGPLVAAGILLGIGLGGFVDGIALHQILQWHNMLSARIPPDNLVNMKINMVWDGLFHAGVWVATALGVLMLWKAGRRQDVTWSGRVLLGAHCIGWGAFNFVEGLINHQLLGLHHVHGYSENWLQWDIAFLISGIVLVVLGWILLRSEHRSDRADGFRES